MPVKGTGGWVRRQVSSLPFSHTFRGELFLPGSVCFRMIANKSFLWVARIADVRGKEHLDRFGHLHSLESHINIQLAPRNYMLSVFLKQQLKFWNTCCFVFVLPNVAKNPYTTVAVFWAWRFFQRRGSGVFSCQPRSCKVSEWGSNGGIGGCLVGSVWDQWWSVISGL